MHSNVVTYLLKQIIKYIVFFSIKYKYKKIENKLRNIYLQFNMNNMHMKK